MRGFFLHGEHTHRNRCGGLSSQRALKQSPWRPGFKRTQPHRAHTRMLKSWRVRVLVQRPSQKCVVCIKANIASICPSLANWCCVMLEEDWRAEQQGRCYHTKQERWHLKAELSARIETALFSWILLFDRLVKRSLRRFSTRDTIFNKKHPHGHFIDTLIQYNHSIPLETKSVTACCKFLPVLIMQS